MPSSRHTPLAEALMRLDADGHTLVLRRIMPADVEPMLAFQRGLSFGDRYFRYGTPAYQPSQEDIQRQCSADPEESRHFIVVAHRQDRARIVAAADCCMRLEADACEFAILVDAAWRRRGLARWLLGHLVDCAREQGLRRMVGKTLGSNLAMLGLARGAGFTLLDGGEGPAIATLSLSLDGTELPV